MLAYLKDNRMSGISIIVGNSARHPIEYCSSSPDAHTNQRHNRLGQLGSPFTTLVDHQEDELLDSFCVVPSLALQSGVDVANHNIDFKTTYRVASCHHLQLYSHLGSRPSGQNGLILICCVRSHHLSNKYLQIIS